MSEDTGLRLWSRACKGHLNLDLAEAHLSKIHQTGCPKSDEVGSSRMLCYPGLHDNVSTLPLSIKIPTSNRSPFRETNSLQIENVEKPCLFPDALPFKLASPAGHNNAFNMHSCMQQAYSTLCQYDDLGSTFCQGRRAGAS